MKKQSNNKKLGQDNKRDYKAELEDIEFFDIDDEAEILENKIEENQTQVSMDTVGMEPIFMDEEDSEIQKRKSPSAKRKSNLKSHTKAPVKRSSSKAVAKKSGNTGKHTKEDTNFFLMLLHKISAAPAVDKIIVSTGALVLVLAIVTGTVYASAKAVDEQVATFYQVGENLETIGVAGESGLLAITDAQVALKNAVEDAEEAFDAEAVVEDDSVDGVEIVLNMSSVEKDLKIKFVNKATKKLISNIPFEVEITDPNKKVYTKEDDDKDGIIYQTNLTPGSYKVALVGTEALTDYKFSTEVQTVTVKDKIVYQKIDVTDEVKTESQINASKEDTQQQLPETAPTLKDTVEWVESTKTPITGDAGDGETGEYIKISHGDITDPLTVSGLNRLLRLSAQMPEKTTEPGSSTQPESSTQPGSSTQPESSTPPTPSESGSEDPGTKDQTVTSVSVSSDKSSLEKSQTATVKINTTYSGGAGAKPSTQYSFSASPSEAVSISGSGDSITVTAKGVTADTAVTITGKEDNSGKSNTCSITIKKETAEVSVGLAASPTTVKVGETSVIKATTSDNLGVTWDALPDGLTQESVSIHEIKVKAAKTGSFTVSAKAKGNSAKTASVAVSVSASNCKLTFDPTVKEIRVGETLKAADFLKIENKPSDKNVEWSSSKTEIATVDTSGVVTTKAAGESVITAKVGDVSAILTVKVLASDLSVKLDKDKVTAYVDNELTLKITTTNGAGGDSYEWSSSDTKRASVKAETDGKSAVIKGIKTGETTITVKVTSGSKTATATCKVTVSANPKSDTTTKLKDNDGKQVYIKNDKGEYVEATWADYYTGEKLYILNGKVEYKYTGWQTIDDKTYFFDKDGKKITGEQIIQGAKYTFDSDGVLQKSSGTMGFDISKWNADINWAAVKNSGVSYVIIRCGYRGSSTGVLVQDPTFKKNINGALGAGLKVGIYFFSQAINEVEAVEEASMVLSLIKGYKISFPVFTDIEGSGGRGDLIDRNTRTKVANAFCQTIKNGGYTPGVYANKNWFETKMNTASLTGYKLWLAQYAAAPTYSATKFDMWQYTSKGSVSGIKGNVDMNISYLGY